MRYLLLLASLCLALISAAAEAKDLKSDAAEIAKVFYGWTVARVENLPGGIGHVLLTNGEYEYKEGFGQQGGQGAAPRGTKIAPPKYDFYVFTEFFAVPAGQSRAKGDLPWGKDRRPFYHSEKVDLGDWNGFHWYADIGLYEQARLRKKLGFDGGDDRLDLLIRGLGIKDQTTSTFAAWTSNGCTSQLGLEGAEAIPYIERALSEKPAEIGEQALRSLGTNQDPDATRILIRYFSDPNQKLRNAAASALSEEPFREEAKAAYMAMIGDRRNARAGAKAAAQFGWKEALPLVREALEDSGYMFVYRDLYIPYRELQGTPIAKELFQAEGVLIGLVSKDPDSRKELAHAIAVFKQSPDHEAVAMISLSLSGWLTKAETSEVRAIARDILDSLPRTAAIADIRKLMASVKQDTTLQEQAKKVLAEWGA